mmetsp:Transcript_51902/g.97090  ORF Transcript_51902/g.97090 Transcript_51902/m.97090 type:complete len:85 (-) Transcript_51902:399-653(-)
MPFPVSCEYETSKSGTENTVQVVAMTVKASMPESFKDSIRSFEVILRRVCASDDPNAHVSPNTLQSTSVALAMDTPAQIGKSEA